MSEDHLILEAIEALRDEVHALRIDSATRADRHQTTVKRRSSFAALLVALVVTVQASDVHTERCAPGHRAEAIVAARLAGEGSTFEEVRGVAERNRSPWFCDASFPTHSHIPGDSWPSAWNVLGFGGYAALGGLLFFYVRNATKKV